MKISRIKKDEIGLQKSEKRIAEKEKNESAKNKPDN
jgi:hypothetical protein